MLLRDKYGLVQCVINKQTDGDNTQTIKYLKQHGTFESVLHVTGTIQKRPTGQEKPELPNGFIEVRLNVISTNLSLSSL